MKKTKQNNHPTHLEHSALMILTEITQKQNITQQQYALTVMIDTAITYREALNMPQNLTEKPSPKSLKALEKITGILSSNESTQHLTH